MKFYVNRVLKIKSSPQEIVNNCKTNFVRMNISRSFERAKFPLWILYRRLTYISWKPLSSSWPPNIFLAIAQPPVRTNDVINRGSRLRAPSIIVKDVYEGYEWCLIHVGIADEVHQYRVYPQQTTKTHKRVH